jgi:hypothetical membrane protein
MFRAMKVLKDHSTAFAWVGMLAVAIFIIIWLCAESVDTAWQFGVDKLSLFGISDTDAKFYFNYGCMITGILVAVFGIGRAVYYKNEGHAAGGILLLVGGVALFFVGIFTMNTGDGQMHDFVSVAAALFIFLAMIAIAAGNWFAKREIFAGIGVALIFFLIAMFFAYDLAKLESYGIIVIMIWFLMESVNMIVSGRKS